MGCRLGCRLDVDGRLSDESGRRVVLWIYIFFLLCRCGEIKIDWKEIMGFGLVCLGSNNVVVC